ncbi:Apq12p KNAG_0D01770 [Huiozyma naganishii CBS 8797]|uniref:Uncharacterized protein n=1 Tax=Huiozyma naganishii (strain ATCC MYA-139 / BCRC 22969 / CBS 8797 / KCTC 17520 / NBRC 10181 / NCYC 3082 / Yp74L-3) TaxID=1071383 RepID=J7RK89_HUIN7|nr:hypothetical protein KNAG_0D01770 [Kazachstania naganishii CBS 8797]CCK69928.1 hypothetical protein KNAG_0D01770 [Kazachstania naganishii CBS 8797]
MRLDESQMEEAAQRCVLLLLRWTIRALQLAVPLVQRFSSAHPTLFLYLALFAMVYTSAVVLRNVLGLVRRTMWLLFAVVCAAVYLRGAEQFLVVDLPEQLEQAWRAVQWIYGPATSQTPRTAAHN